ncbi:transposase [Trichocoleus sp. FACHB-90]|uniref:RNA-guided endonuclease TnpB family protein n=1 Tax=Cyanophyceae TaxID=3028117 RepID=UPI001689A131|nr:transposase [Trichocoleus sp. FACHB-90]
MFTLSYEYKLVPTPEQVATIEQTLDVCRKVWNFALRERKDWVGSRKCEVNACSLISEYIIPADAPYPNYHKQAKALTEAKKANSGLKEINAQVLQQVLRTLDRAFEDMRERGFGFPRFKNYARMRSYVYPQMLKNPLRKDAVKLPQLGWVRMRMSRPIPDSFELKQARIVRRPSGYFVILSLQLDVNIPEPNFHGHVIGIDLGLEKFLATSDGKLVARPKFFNSLHRKLKLLQRRLRNKKKGSKNRRKLNQKIARVHQKISDTRKDFHFKTSHYLCDQAQTIIAEDLNLKAMSRGMLCKHTLDAGFGQFLNILSWTCWKRGTHFAKVNPNGTSQECPRCHAQVRKDLSVRIHRCPECGYITDRDVASAQVIRERGIAAAGQVVEQIACGGDAAGAEVTRSSWHPLRQETLGAILGNPRP